VAAAAVEGRDLPLMIEAVGTLQGWEEVTVSSEVPGTIDRVFVDLGDHVKQGQPLVAISPKELRAAYERAEGALARAQAQAEEANRRRARGEEIYKRGILSRQDVEGLGAEDRMAQAAVRERQGEMEIARVRLNEAVIRASIAGYVRRRLVSAGEFIEDKKPVMVLVTPHPLKLVAQVPERYAGEVRGGQAVEVAVEAYPGRTFPGKVTRVGPAVAVESRTFAVEAEVPNKERLLKPGSFAKAAIRVRTDTAVPVIPEAALLTLAGVKKVFVAEGEIARARQVETGRRLNGILEIRSGLKVGERVLVTGHAKLSDGDPIEVK
jgi:RND family efflux transporter MFP subunit